MSDCGLVMDLLSAIAYGISGAMVGGAIIFGVITWLAKR
jgi:hypothetical protein